MEPTIEQLGEEVARLCDELALAEKRYNDARIAAFTERTGIGAGSIIVDRKKTWRVSRVGTRGSLIEVYGQEKTKAGWHASERWIDFYNDNETPALAAQAAEGNE